MKQPIIKNPIQVVTQPTRNPTSIYEMDGKLHYGMELTRGFDEKGVYIYITIAQSVEPIKEGEKGWFYDYNYNTITKVARNINGDSYFRNRDIRKIIATDDPKLLKEHDDTVPYPKMRSTSVAEIQQSFLKEYVANPEGEWEVDYKPKYDTTLISRKPFVSRYEPKISADKTVNITIRDNKVYTKDEVIELFKKYKVDSFKGIMYNYKFKQDNWIKENL